MYQQYKQDFVKFLKPRGMLFLVLLGIMMLMFAVFMILTEAPIFAFILFLAVGVMLVYLGLRTLFQYPGYIRALDGSGYMMQILQDYAHANGVLKNQLRFGAYYLFAKGQGKVLVYTDVARVYQYIHRTNFVEDRRELRYVDREGKEGTLCRLKCRGKSDADLHIIIGMLLQKNPSLQVGYKK